jgi:hypothetical protein
MALHNFYLIIIPGRASRLTRQQMPLNRDLSPFPLQLEIGNLAGALVTQHGAQTMHPGFV